MNGLYLQQASVDRLLTEIGEDQLPKRDLDTLRKAVELHRSRCETIPELRQALTLYGDDPKEYEPAGLKKFGKPENATTVRTLAERLSAVEPFQHAALEEVARVLSTETGLNLGALAQPTRLALTGTLASPPLFEVIEVLGKEATLRRMRSFADHIESRAGAH
jgi:glutamyl-tRNA synthetase